MQFFDLHCDTLYRCLKEEQGLYKNNFDISISQAKKYSLWIQCFAMWIPDDVRGKEAKDLFKKAYNKFRYEMVLNKDFIKQCKTKDDIIGLKDSGKCGAILSIEGSSALGGDLDNLKFISECGVKVITLTWNGHCEVGDGVNVEDPGGITSFGKELIKKMNAIDIIIDVSHASDKLFYDVMSLSTRPVIATHSNSREICNHRRNLTDDQFTCIKNNGGIVGINLCKYFLNSEKEPDFSDILNHVDRFCALSGEKNVSFGTDFDGTDTPNDFNGIGSIENLYEYFLIKNYNEDLVRDLFFNNAYNFFLNTI